MTDRWKKRRRLQRLLVSRTGCREQHTGWPCSTCFHEMRLPGRSRMKWWHATLLLRGDYKHGAAGIAVTPTSLPLLVDALIAHLKTLAAVKRPRR